jgi:hypothetical protein
VPPVRLLAAVLAAVTGLLVVPAPSWADDVESTARPAVRGEAVYGSVLTADPGRWTPAGVTFAYRWLRDGELVRGAAATRRSYRPGLDDLGRRLSVRVVATDADGHRGIATSPATRQVARRPLESRAAPSVDGVQRYGRSVTATPGRWSATPETVRYQWLRDGRPIPGATGSRYTFAPPDVGTRVRVRVTATRAGYRTASHDSARLAEVRHRRDVRRTVTYVVRTNGRITADVDQFARQAAETYADPRGWRGKGVQFRRVRSGGSFTLVLANAATLPSYSSVCSTMWSCRVGRYVVINQTRWLSASPAWNRAHRSRRDYRHMVVNHETGHWLGKGHASCPGRGQLAPVMMQQSKGTQGCRFNPWPTLRELR